MARESQSFLKDAPPSRELIPLQTTGSPAHPTKFWLCFQIVLAYALIEAALWTPPGRLNVVWMAASSLWILLMVSVSSFSAKQMGIAVPPAKGSGWVLLGAIVLAALIPAVSLLLGTDAGPTHLLPLHTAWRYAIWSLVQQFVLESFLFVRLEVLIGPSWAILATATLFSAAHIPSPVLTVLGFLGGLFFCEMFRRYRNIFPLAVAHALFGLTIGASFSDSLLNHMRVGIAYLTFHP